MEIIYIPIWLDLLLIVIPEKAWFKLNLHSNMVRFIIIIQGSIPPKTYEFTFQYG